MPLDKVEIGKQILSGLLNYCIFRQSDVDGYASIKYGRYVIKLNYYPMDFVRFFKKDHLYLVQFLSEGEFTNNYIENNRKIRERALKFFNHKGLYIYFRGKLEFYKDFSMHYIFNVDDEGKYRLRSIHEHQLHNAVIQYWTSVYGIPLTHDKIHLMLYQAMNMAFGWKDDWKKIQKLFQTIEMAKIKEV